MVASTGVGALPVVLMGREADGAWSDPWCMVPLLLVAVGVLANVLTASSVRATAGPNGFTIRWGLVGWPRCTYPLDRIASAEVVDLPWWRSRRRNHMASDRDRAVPRIRRSGDRVRSPGAAESFG